MTSLFGMFKVEIGSSPSYTVGLMEAGKQLVDDLVEKGLLDSTTRIVVDVYDSLSPTGKGHHTDIAIIVGLAGNGPATVDIDSIPGFIRDMEECERLLLAQGRYKVDFPRGSEMYFHNGNLSLHEDGMQIHVYNGDEAAYSKTYYSIGDGFIINEEHFGQGAANEVSVPCPFKSAIGLLAYCNEIDYSLSDLTMQNELALHNKKEIDEYFMRVRQTMQICIDRGVNTEGVLPGSLHVLRHAPALRRMLVPNDELSNDLMNVIDWADMFAPAVNEENTVGGRAATASTSDTCGVVPAVLTYYDHFIKSVSPDTYTCYFMAMSAIGALYKMNTSISSAEIGCQGEVGVTYSMAATGLAGLLGSSPEQVCVAAEIGMGYSLGSARDPAAGQVRVPCIERNAIVSVKAISAARVALRRTSAPRILLGRVIEVMYETGKNTSTKYCETSRGGLAVKIQCG